MAATKGAESNIKISNEVYTESSLSVVMVGYLALFDLFSHGHLR